MQVKHTFLASYTDSKERQAVIKKIYRQLYKDLQCTSEETCKNNKKDKKEVDLWL